MNIKRLNKNEFSKVLPLVWKTFLKFESPNYSEEGVQTFFNSINNQAFIHSLDLYAAYENLDVVGVIATRNKGSHIALFFVEENYQSKGIGRKLFEEVRLRNQSNKVTVNSSPYAVNIYHSLGFVDTDIEQVTNGMKYTPMVYKKL